MAKEKDPELEAAKAERKRLQDEKKQLKKEQQNQKKEAKKRAKEIAKQEAELDDDDGGSGILTFFATIIIVAIWLAIICVLIKLDVGGFGSSVMKPLIGDVPGINRILPGNSLTDTANPDAYGGYSNLPDAVEQIKALELQIDRLQVESAAKDNEIDTLKAEVLRLQEFENMQVEFQRIRTEFYEEVVYSDKAPGADVFQKYYETMDPATAEYIYKQVIAKLQVDKEIQDYALAYSEMKPKQAAGIFESMENNLDLVAKILECMNAEDRGKILGVMDADIAAKLTKIMDPDS